MMVVYESFFSHALQRKFWLKLKPILIDNHYKTIYRAGRSECFSWKLCEKLNGVFPKCNWNSVNSANSGNLINHWSLNWSQFKDPVYLSSVSLWHCGSILVSYIRDQRFKPFKWQIYFVTFSENSNDTGDKIQRNQTLFKLKTKSQFNPKNLLGCMCVWCFYFHVILGLKHIN